MRKLKARNCMPIAGKEGEEKGRGSMRSHHNWPNIAKTVRSLKDHRR